jgi:hypothetical protein
MTAISILSPPNFTMKFQTSLILLGCTALSCMIPLSA